MLAQILSERAELSSAADFQRHRIHASNRAASLRKKHGLALRAQECGLAKPHKGSKPEHWTLTLWLAERAWSAAQEQRAELATSSRHGSRQKTRYISRLAKAQKLAALAASFASELDTISSLEALSYAHMAAGELALQQKMWPLAVTELSHARVALEALSTSSASGDSAELTQYITNRVDPALRLALAKVPADAKNSTANRTADVPQYARTVVSGGDRSSALVKALIVVNPAVLETPPSAPLAELGELTWRSRKIHVRDADLAQAVLSAHIAEATLLQEQPKTKPEAYDEVLKSWQDAIALANEMLTNAESDSSTEVANELYVVLSYLQFSLLCRRIQRDCAVLDSSAAETRARDSVRVYDVVLQSCEELTDLRGVFNDAPLASAVDRLTRTFRARRSAALADCYTKAGEYIPALALLKYALDQVSVDDSNGLADEDLHEAERLLPLGSADYAESKTQVQAAFAAAHGRAQLAVAAADLYRNNPESYISDDLTVYPRGDSEEILKRIVRPGVHFNPTMVKPVFYDLAFEMLRYTDEADIK